MKPFFDTAAKIEQLRAVAESWRGTPWMPNAAIKGAGVSCQKLAGEIYRECGLTVPEIPDGPMNWSQANTRSLIAEFVDGLGFVEPIPFIAYVPSAGDLVGFKIGGCVQHLGIMLDNRCAFIHAFRNQGVMFSELTDPAFFQRVGCIWRPINWDLPNRKS